MRKRAAWTPRYTEYLIRRLENDLFPKLGSRPIKDISAPELLSVVRIIENRGASELANRALQILRANLHVCGLPLAERTGIPRMT